MQEFHYILQLKIPKLNLDLINTFKYISLELPFNILFMLHTTGSYIIYNFM